MIDIELFKLFGTVLIEDRKALDALKSIDKKGKEVASGTSKLTSAFAKVGNLIAGAFSVGVVVAFGKTIIETTANISAMEAQFDQVFKGDQKTAMANITQQAKTLGIHVDRLTGTWSKFGGQVKGAGMDSAMALSTTQKATLLAADAAAFYDQTLEASSASIASFMKGNFAAGDAIGVFTSAKQMDVKANDKYQKSWADLTEVERLYLLLETVEKTYELNGAMGQAVRESNNWANVTENLKAKWSRFLATIGTPLLESATSAVIWLTDAIDYLTDGLALADKAYLNITLTFQKFNEWAVENKTIAEILTIALGTLTVAIIAFNGATILATANSWLETAAIIALYGAQYIGAAATTALTFATTAFGSVLAFITSPITLVILGIGALIAVVYLLIKNWDTVKSKTYEVWNSILKFISSAVTSITSVISNTFNKIKDIMIKPFVSARSAIGVVIDKIKGFLNFNWQFPKLKMPHFKVTGSANPLDWFKQGVPKLNVQWYAKGAIFDKPTLFNTPYGLKGVGEAGPEVVAPISDLKEMLGLNQERKLEVNLHIENFNNNDSVDIENLADELAFMIKRKLEGSGGFVLN